VRDAADLADLRRMGRLPEAWIAPPQTRELRELVRYRATPCPHQLSEGMTGSRTNPALPQRICAITAWRRPTTTISPLTFRHPPTACTGPAQRQDRSSSLRCGRSVLTPVLTRRCLPGGRKPAKPLVDNLLTKTRPFRDDKLGPWDVYTRFFVCAAPPPGLSQSSVINTDFR
jgi:hypothetical protein